MVPNLTTNVNYYVQKGVGGSGKNIKPICLPSVAIFLELKLKFKTSRYRTALQMNGQEDRGYGFGLVHSYQVKAISDWSNQTTSRVRSRVRNYVKGNNYSVKRCRLHQVLIH